MLLATVVSLTSSTGHWLRDLHELPETCPRQLREFIASCPHYPTAAGGMVNRMFFEALRKAKAQWERETESPRPEDDPVRTARSTA